jgi:hypothetical protein
LLTQFLFGWFLPGTARASIRTIAFLHEQKLPSAKLPHNYALSTQKLFCTNTNFLLQNFRTSAGSLHKNFTEKKL